VSAASDILSRYQHIVRSLTFTTGSKGVFDVTVDGSLRECLKNGVSACWPDMLTRLWVGGKGTGDE
jgi:hypothetical protein